MIYMNFVELHCLMLHAKFQNHRPSGSGEDFFKVFAIYSHGGHLGHVTWTIHINFHCPFLMMLKKSLALIGQVVSEEKMFEYNMVKYMHLALGQGTDNLFYKH